MNKSRKEYLKEFKSEECFCGKPKKPRMALCYSCYKSLPIDMQRDLWLPFGGGFEEAWDEAIEYLND